MKQHQILHPQESCRSKITWSQCLLSCVLFMNLENILKSFSFLPESKICWPWVCEGFYYKTLCQNLISIKFCFTVRVSIRNMWRHPAAYVFYDLMCLSIIWHLNVNFMGTSKWQLKLTCVENIRDVDGRTRHTFLRRVQRLKSDVATTQIFI